MFRLAPAPREGELLYSVLARLGAYLNAIDVAPFMEGLVGRRGGIASPGLPGGLAMLVRDLPEADRERAIDRIVDRLTAYPFHSAFVPAAVRDDVRHAMRGDVTGVYTRLGLATFKVGQPTRLRFCPDCLDDMDRGHPDLWWRREHQLAGVPVCAIHGTVLRFADVEIGERGRHSFTPATRRVCRAEAEPVLSDASAADTLRLHDLARSAVDLLDRPPAPMEHVDRSDAYRRRLADVGLMRSRRKVDVGALHAAFAEHWGGVPDLIAGLRLAEDREHSWLTALVRTRARGAPPVQHLMLTGMLDRLSPPSVDRPFGVGPWPCRNPVADHLGLDVVGRSVSGATRASSMATSSAGVATSTRLRAAPTGSWASRDIGGSDPCSAPRCRRPSTGATACAPPRALSFSIPGR